MLSTDQEPDSTPLSAGARFARRPISRERDFPPFAIGAAVLYSIVKHVRRAVPLNGALEEEVPRGLRPTGIFR